MKPKKKPKASAVGVTQRTYHRVKSELKDAQGNIGSLNLAIRNLKIALDGYYEMHNHLSRCECGFCDHARRLVRYPYKPTLREIEDDRRSLSTVWRK